MSKIPTAQQSLDSNVTVVIPFIEEGYNGTGVPYNQALQAIESHTAAHTEGLREENARFKKAFADATAEKLALRERVKELEAEKERLKIMVNQMGDALDNFMK